LPFINNIHDLYSFYVIPELGGIIANDKASYQYLVGVLEPKQEEFKSIIKQAGLGGVNYTNLSVIFSYTLWG
jgi:ubiquinone/menaquinone biosynthesis C-methylase UbiE